MKKFVLILILAFSYVLAQAQCTPLPYQDSLYSIWPDTIDNLPVVYQGVNYSTTITIKTPTTVIEAAGYDTSLTTVLGQYVGHWPVDSMELLSISGLPSGITHSCLIPSCVIPGNTLTCAALSGNTSDPVGIYPIVMDVKVYTHGTVTIIVQIPIDTSVTEQILGYKLEINSGTEVFDIYSQDDFVLLQNAPNPFDNYTNIKFNTPRSTNVEFTVIDMFGRKVFTDQISANRGENAYQFTHDLSSGIYMYNIDNGEASLSKRMIIAER
ncbi:MAG: T9SS type A sorting domain-containing protein [Bacteroidota bacterium]|nr:T9SS type A sorting domain-containing protein [Bacteroidota bacterium]